MACCGGGPDCGVGDAKMRRSPSNTAPFRGGTGLLFRGAPGSQGKKPTAARSAGEKIDGAQRKVGSSLLPTGLSVPFIGTREMIGRSLLPLDAEAPCSLRPKYLPCRLSSEEKELDDEPPPSLIHHRP